MVKNKLLKASPEGTPNQLMVEGLLYDACRQKNGRVKNSKSGDFLFRGHSFACHAAVAFLVVSVLVSFTPVVPESVFNFLLAAQETLRVILIAMSFVLFPLWCYYLVTRTNRLQRYRLPLQYTPQKLLLLLCVPFYNVLVFRKSSQNLEDLVAEPMRLNERSGSAAFRALAFILVSAVLIFNMEVGFLIYGTVLVVNGWKTHHRIRSFDLRLQAFLKD